MIEEIDTFAGCSAFGATKQVAAEIARIGKITYGKSKMVFGPVNHAAFAMIIVRKAQA
ncbi:MAG TPA: hypothetical protein VN154_13310 [Rhizomicrobium sp.]|nr:hypothetical protein [Rhizomicrobium sp.]